MLTRQKFVPDGKGENYDYSQDHCFVKLAAQDTSSNTSFVVDEIKPDFYLDRHYHKVMTEVFYVLNGEIELIFDDETLLLKEGDTLVVPPNTWHTAQCRDGAKMITIFVNGRFDKFLNKLSTMNDADFADTELMKKINAEYDIYHE